MSEDKHAEILAYKKGSFTMRSNTQFCPCGHHMGTSVGRSKWRVRRYRDGGRLHCYWLSAYRTPAE